MGTLIILFESVFVADPLNINLNQHHFLFNEHLIVSLLVESI